METYSPGLVSMERKAHGLKLQRSLEPFKCTRAIDGSYHLPSDEGCVVSFS